MASRARNNAKAKEKKQKIIAAVGGVLLLALLAYQVPKVMSHGKHAPAPQSGAPSATSTATTSATAPAATAAPTGTAELAASNTKLASFTLFSSKDPFVPRVSDKVPASSTPSTSTPAAATPPATSGSTSTPAGSGPLFGTVDGPATATPSPTSGTKTPPASKLPGAVLKLNGTKIRVQLGEAFPKNQPIFRLAGIKKGSVKIALVKGGLADGTSAVTLAKGHPLTLVNTADNKRWTIVLLSANKGT